MKEYRIVQPPKASATAALAASGRALADGLVKKVASFAPVSQEERARRLEFCNTCPERKQVTLRDKQIASICGKCGCVCEAKAAVKAFKCPLGKW